MINLYNDETGAAGGNTSMFVSRSTRTPRNAVRGAGDIALKEEIHQEGNVISVIAGKGLERDQMGFLAKSSGSGAASPEMGKALGHIREYLRSRKD